jgi:outer membrane protein assembly factor BamD (BamD/ComL family)
MKITFSGMLKTMFCLLCLLMLLSACSDKKAAELYDTAKFEELQNNREHALQLYERIIVAHPSSEYALKAKERADELREKVKNKN